MTELSKRTPTKPATQETTTADFGAVAWATSNLATCKRQLEENTESYCRISEERRQAGDDSPYDTPEQTIINNLDAALMHAMDGYHIVIESNQAVTIEDVLAQAYALQKLANNLLDHQEVDEVIERDPRVGKAVASVSAIGWSMINVLRRHAAADLLRGVICEQENFYNPPAGRGACSCDTCFSYVRMEARKSQD